MGSGCQCSEPPLLIYWSGMRDGYLVGVDEAGRGPLAGPVVAGAACFLNEEPRSYLKDSKLLSARKRETAYEQMGNEGVCFAVGMATREEIDEMNIGRATRLAMVRAVERLEEDLRGRGGEISSLVIDGTQLLDLPLSQRALPKADRTEPVCMAASIAAKVERDRIMERLHEEYPVYGFDRHKGYGTRHHMEMIRAHGACPAHRRSFRPFSGE